LENYTISELEDILNSMDSDDPSRYKLKEYIDIEKEFRQGLEEFKQHRKTINNKKAT
jgi:hypothetical protein